MRMIHMITTVCLLTLLCNGLLNAQWIQTSLDSIPVRAFAVRGTDLFAGTSIGIFLSNDNGANWTPLNSGLTNTSIYALYMNGDHFFAGSYGSGVFLSTDYGTSWMPVNAGMTTALVRALTFIGTDLLAGTYNVGIHRSPDYGVSWIAVNAGMPVIYQTYALAVKGNYVFAGTYGNGVYRATMDSVIHWTAFNNGLTLRYNQAFAVRDSLLFVGTNGHGVFLSTDDGANWSPANVGMTTRYVFALTFAGTNLFAGTGGYGVFLSTNNGTTWTTVNEGLPSNTTVNALAISATYLFAGTSNGVWRRPLSEMVTSVGTGSDRFPQKMMLNQNYPNPFNPATTISFDVPQKSFVSLKVFDALGREVAILASEEMPAGEHARHWSASDKPSGIYFYRLQAGSFTATKKLVLLK